MKQQKALPILLLLAALVMGANTWGLDIYILDEAKNASCAREMWQRNDWIVPTFNGKLRTDKPPLHYYFMQLGYTLFGATAFAARFFSVVCGILTVWLTYRFTRQELGETAAFWAGLGLVASLQVAIQFHLATPDPYLIFLLTLGQFLWFRGVTQERLGYLYVSYVVFGLGVLTKGPIAIVLPGLAFLLFLGVSGRLTWRGFLAVHPFRGLLVALLTAAPWYWAVGEATDGAWLRGFFLEHNLDRFSSPKEGHGGIFLITPLIFFVALLPFSIFLPQALRRVWQDRKQHELLLFALSVVAVVVTFFSISSTKLPSYPAPAFPFGAIILGYWIARQPRLKSLRISLWVWLVLSVLIVVGVAVGLRFDRSLSELSWLAVYFAGLPLGAVLALFWILRRREVKKGLYALAGGMLLTCFGFFYGAFPRADQENPVHVALEKMDPNRPFVAYKRFNPAFVFNLGDTVQKFEQIEALRTYLQAHPEAYILAAKRHDEEVQQVGRLREVVRQRDLFEIPTTVVWEYVPE